MPIKTGYFVSLPTHYPGMAVYKCNSSIGSSDFLRSNPCRKKALSCRWLVLVSYYTCTCIGSDTGRIMAGPG